MARSGALLLPTILLAAIFSLAPSFVAPPRATGAPEVIPASGIVATLLSAAPAPAHAYSETELNQFGLVFAIFFLGFFVAGLVRMFTVGKL
mmetsp:Transcript_110524/g.155135  ORF Transcript_110524/g.155135 Transcript_110524/m.155135 type:complete len:91 (+) Transcript_110524:63-335(+)|eukprot:symbB.v1.2.030711.t1/scaffold3492.1/size55497/1